MSDLPPPNQGNQSAPGPQPYLGQGQQYPPPGAQPAYGQGFRPKHPQAILVLVLGVAGFFLCQLLGPFAWVMGNKTLKEIDANPAQYDGRTEALVGKILGIVSTIILILSIIALILAVLFFIIFAASSPEIFSELENETYSSALGAVSR